MKGIKRPAQAGTLESGDILVQINPAEPGFGIRVELESPVKKQFGAHMEQLIVSLLHSAGIEDALVHATDRGALDYAIEARVETALTRALAEEESHG